MDPLIRALLYGSLEGLPEAEIFLFARTGLIHLFSASGFHMGAALGVSTMCSRFLLPLKNTRQRVSATFLLSLALMGYFGAVTEWSSPMVRAFVFAALRAFAEAMEIRASTLRLFLLSLLAAALLGRGSWLSFLLSALGMAAILSVKPKRWWALCLAPWLGSLPITTWVFGLVSLSAPLWNLLIGTAIACSVLPLAILGLLLKPIGASAPFFQLAATLMRACTELLTWGDSHLGGAFWVEPLPWALSATALIAAWIFRRKKYALALLLLAALVPFQRDTRLALLDVGQGDSIYLRAGGANLLVDFGPPGRKGRTAPAATALEQLAVGPLDNLLLTHPDLDHRGGLDSLLTRHRVRGALWLREDSLELKGSAAVLEAAERAQIPIRFLERGSPPGLKCQLHEAKNSNDFSPLCRAELEGGKSLLLTGDMSAEQEESFQVPQVDYLKLAHHGSRFSSSSAFLRASGAKVALISVGRKNRYGHPTAAALERAQNAGMEIRRTDLEGTLRLE